MATIDYKQKIKDYMNSSEVDTLYKSMLNTLFPELAESEDEKIRKELLQIAKESEDSLYNLCGRPECKSCFGILYQGKIKRKGFESIVRPKPEKAYESNKLKIYPCGHKNVYCENIITLLPKITRGIEAICIVSNGKDYLVENCSASRIDIPIFGFSNNVMERNQWNLCWNVTPVYNMNINDRIDNNRLIVDYYMKEYGFKKYLFVGDFYQGEHRFPSVQVREVK